VATRACSRRRSQVTQSTASTVRALALERMLEIELRDELAPDAPAADASALLAELLDTALVCTHREVIERLFDGDVTCEKGAAWVVDRVAGRLDAVAYVPSPTSRERASPNAFV